LKFERYGLGIAKGLGVTIKYLWRHPITTQYPEQRLTTSRRIRGNELIWDKERCSGCTTCARTCPQGAIFITTGKDVINFAPCSQACPAGIEIPRYLRFITEGKPAEAVAIIREKIPFPFVCGRVCIHPCEKNCQRTQLDGAISIRALKRYATDHDATLSWKENSRVAASTGKRVAIVGGGPAGLTAAYYLAKLGHKVTVYEALPEPGGMMRVGIPDYRLPKNLLKAEIKEIENVGVEIKTNARVESLDKLFAEGFQAVFLAIGAHEGMKLDIEGEDKAGVVDCAAFLRDVSLGRDVKVGSRVAIIGGGNAAIDSARTALRLGAKEVTMVYRRTRAEMPAAPEEVEAAMDEGVKFSYLAAPTRIIGQNGALQLESVRMELGEPDASGRRRPEPVKGSEFIMEFDNIIAAIGQRPNVPKQFGIPTGRGNVIEANKDTLATSKEGVFAGGDAMTGPASVIQAIAAGRQAAISIDKYLGGKGVITEKLAPPQVRLSPLTQAQGGQRVSLPELESAERVSNFNEVELGLPREKAVEEGNRCLRCDVGYTVEQLEVDIGYCISCGLCVESCPRHALDMGYEYEKSKYRREELVMKKENFLESKDKPSAYFRPEFEKSLPPQTLLIDRDKQRKK